MSRFAVLPSSTLQGLQELAEGLSLVQLVFVLLWWLAIIFRRICDCALELCGLMFVLLQGNMDTVVVRSSEPGTSTTRISPEESFASNSRDNSDEVYWKNLFDNPELWWDNHLTKKNSRAPDFKHKESRKALWIEGWFTPSWVRARFEG